MAVTAAMPGAALAGTNVLFGQQQSYSVTLRGNGEAVVVARMVFTNHTTAPMTSLKVSVVGASPSDVAAYQQTITPTACISPAIYPPVPCAMQKPDYTLSPTYYDSQSTYAKSKVTTSGSTYELSLPVAVQPEGSSAVLVSYAAKGYVTTRWGRSTYHFQTLKVDERVASVQVAIDTDSDLYLDGVSSKVNYSRAETGASLSRSTDIASTNAAELNRIASYIGNDGRIIKSAKNLAAGDTFTVAGVYADAVWKLQLTRYAVGLGALAASLTVLAGLVVVARRTRRLRPEATWPQLFEILPVVTGLLAAAAIGALAWGLVSFATSTAGASPYGTAGAPDAYTQIILTVFGILMFLVVAVGPAVWIGAARRQWRAAGFSVLWQVIGLLALLLLYSFVIRPAAAPAPGDNVVMPLSGGAAIEDVNTSAPPATGEATK